MSGRHVICDTICTSGVVWGVAEGGVQVTHGLGLNACTFRNTTNTVLVN